jgi:hypothetical protein
VNSRFIDWIWQVRGSLALAPMQSSDDAFDRLDPLFRETGTTFERTDDTLVFQKKAQHAQDKMAVFDGGVLRIEQRAGGSVLRYRLTSRALLFCFLAPLLFLGFAQLTIALGNMEKPSTEAADKSEEKEDPAEKYAKMPMNPIDEFLGAPAPEKPEKDKDKDKEDEKKPSPTPAYVFAALFATLYVVGRILEDRLIKARFRKRLLGS